MPIEFDWQSRRLGIDPAAIACQPCLRELYVCVHMLVYVYFPVCVHVHIEARGQPCGPLWDASQVVFLSQGLSLGLELMGKARLTGWWLQVHPHACLFIWVLAIEPRSSCLPSKEFTNSAISSPPWSLCDSRHWGMSYGFILFCFVFCLNKGQCVVIEFPCYGLHRRPGRLWLLSGFYVGSHISDHYLTQAKGFPHRLFYMRKGTRNLKFVSKL